MTPGLPLPPKATLAALTGLLVLNASALAADTTAPAVEVVAISPVRGLDVAREDIPSPVQSLSIETLAKHRQQSLPELLANRLNGVTVNEITGNPYQSDLNYRGYTASPLLGTPQGLSVYQDGVRINEAFGDVVGWDLIPRAAIASIDLIPGSNPLFGLNTLGGALSINTKSGLSHPGGRLEAGAGSFGRRELEAEVGRKFGDFGVYVSGTRFRDNGWRDASPSQVDQVFAKLSQQRGALDWNLSYTGAKTNLTGNGLLPESMLATRRESIFTKPDTAQQQLHLLNLNASYWLDDKARLSGVLYSRHNTARTLNGDANDEFEGSANDGAETGGSGIGTDIAANNRTRTEQRSWGTALQWSRIDDDNAVAFGATIDQSNSTFQQTSELGVFDAARGVIVNAGGERLNNRLTGRTRHWSLFATDTYKPWSDLAITTSLRYNRARVSTVDQLTRTAPNLDGDYTYSKLNPSLGAAWTLSPGLILFANAGQGNRVPSPIELGCADPANPCSLPNSMQADPFLKQVVTRTLEAGMRGKAGKLSWNATAFRADNHDDILFVGTSTSAGYFTNFGRTKRQGLELGASTDLGGVSLRADYAYIKASYQSAACLLAENNSTRGQSAECTTANQDDEILVRPGNRIPGIPLHSLKFGADWRVTTDWTLSADLVAYSSQYLRGNENNAHQAGVATDRVAGDTRTFLGAGSANGYSVVNLSSRLKLSPRLTFGVRVSNVFNTRYSTAGALAENPFNAAGSFQTNSDNWARESFLAPGAPRSLFLNVALELD